MSLAGAAPVYRRRGQTNWPALACLAISAAFYALAAVLIGLCA